MEKGDHITVVSAIVANVKPCDGCFVSEEQTGLNSNTVIYKTPEKCMHDFPSNRRPLYHSLLSLVLCKIKDLQYLTGYMKYCI